MVLLSCAEHYSCCIESVWISLDVSISFVFTNLYAECTMSSFCTNCMFVSTFGATNHIVEVPWRLKKTVLSFINKLKPKKCLSFQYLIRLQIFVSQGLLCHFLTAFVLLDFGPSLFLEIKNCIVGFLLFFLFCLICYFSTLISLLFKLIFFYIPFITFINSQRFLKFGI